MPVFKLQKKGDNLSNAELIEASKTNLDLEKHLECWLEQSPWAIAQEPILIIGRQTLASFEDSHVFPDLLGLDKDGNIVIVELKKGKTPREVVAQLLEYASWASELSDDDICGIAERYFLSVPQPQGKTFTEMFYDMFETEELPSLNQRLRLYVAAEEITPTVSRVCRFLRTAHGVDVECVEFLVYQTESGEILLNSQVIVGQEEVIRPKKNVSERWSGDKPVKVVVWETVRDLTQGNKDHIFTPKDVIQIIMQKYPTFNKSIIRCQIISDCVNHNSRHHYPSGEDRYWLVEKGKYRLYEPERDRI